MNDSSTGGYLAPGGAAPAEDLALDVLFQGAVAAITGIPGQYVRPRFQDPPPKRPAPPITWCAIGVMLADPDDSPAITHQEAEGEAPAVDIVVRHEQLHVLASFYGPQAGYLAGVLRDGFSLPQNMEALQAQQIGLVRVGPRRRVGEVINQRQVQRVDLPLWFNREVTRTYPIDDIAIVDIHLFDATGVVNATIPVPPPEE